MLICISADFDEAAMAAVLNISTDKAKSVRKRLIRHSLIEVNFENRRFNLHDLVKVFTDIRIRDTERFQTQFLHAKYYESILQKAQKMQNNREKDYYINALRLIDTEWANLMAGQRWSARFTEESSEIATLCAHYSGCARDFMILRLTTYEDMTWLNAGLKASKLLNNREYEGNMLGNLGLAHESLEEYEIAIEYHNKSLIISQELGDKLGESSDLGNLGNCYNSLKEFDRAIEYQKQALEISISRKDKAEQAKDLSNIGRAYYGLEKFEEAIDYQEKSLSIKREVGDLQGEANSLGSLGFAYHGLGDIEKACQYWKAAKDIFENIDSPKADIFLQPLEENNCL